MEKIKKSAREIALHDMKKAGIDINAFLMYELLIERIERTEDLELKVSELTNK